MFEQYLIFRQSHGVLCGSRLCSKVGKMNRIFVNFLHENLHTVRVNINAHRLHRILLASVDFILCVDYLVLFSVNLWFQQL